MKKILTIAALAATVAIGGLATQAQARNGGAVAAGVIGGLAAGAIIGGAVQQRSYYDGPTYAVEPAYAAPGREMCVERREVWSNRQQNYVVRSVRVPC